MIDLKTFHLSGTVEALARAQQSDREAWQWLCERYATEVWRIAARIFDDHVHAEDACQEVFIHLYQKAGAFSCGQRTMQKRNSMQKPGSDVSPSIVASASGDT